MALMMMMIIIIIMTLSSSNMIISPSKGINAFHLQQPESVKLFLAPSPL
jgi:hypothetical protein